MRLDEDAVRLLEAMHRGCAVRLDDEDGLRWHVEPRTVIPMRLYGEDEITLVDPDSDETLSGKQAGPRRRLDDWPQGQPYLRLGAGVLLIRTGLAARRGIALLLTSTGRSLAASRIGEGVDISGSPIHARMDLPAPLLEISEEPIEFNPFHAVDADQRLTILPAPGRRGVVLRFSAAGRRLDTTIDEEDLRRTIVELRQAIDLRNRLLVRPSGNTRLLKGGRGEKIEIEAIEDFERAIVALRAPNIEAFIEAIERALSDDVATVLQPIAVAYGTFDAVLSSTMMGNP